VLLVCVVHFIHDIWKLVFFRSGIDWKLFLHFGVPSIIAAGVGAFLVINEQSVLLSSLLGLVLVFSVVALALFPAIQLPNTLTSGVIGGAISGFFAGLFGLRGAIRSLFMVAMDVDKMSFIGTSGVISFFIDVTRLLVYYAHGLALPTMFYGGMVFFVAASFFGVYVGKIIVRYISQQQFNYMISSLLFLMGIKLFLTPWIG
jgi:Sulfite exporter TauE/SafE.